MKKKAEVTLTYFVEVEFEDDGELELMDQAIEAAEDELSCFGGADEVRVERIWDA